MSAPKTEQNEREEYLHVKTQCPLVSKKMRKELVDFLTANWKNDCCIALESALQDTVKVKAFSDALDFVVSICGKTYHFAVWLRDE